MESERRPEKIDLRLPTIALVGRVNVGKSTLFNRILEKKQAVESPQAGTTRTRNIGVFTWRGVEARLVDAGGLSFHKEQDFESEVLQQTHQAIAEADLVWLVVDAQTGLLPQEKEIAKFLQRAKKPVLIVANKVDAPRHQPLIHEREWLQLGFGTPRPVSAVNGTGVGDLLDEAYKIFHRLPRRPKKMRLLPDIRVAIIGKPNAGKSTLLNQIVGENLVITSPLPHTTREAFTLLVKWEENIIEFVDTAGLRRRAHVAPGLEKIGASQSVKKLEQADVVLLLIDATDPFSSQEKHLAKLIADRRRSVIMVVNKWDLVPDHSDENRAVFADSLFRYYPGLRHAAVVFLSAKTGWRVHQLYAAITTTAAARHKKMDANELDAFLQRALKKQLPTRGKGVRFPKIYSLKQIGTDPPEFQVAVKARTSLHQSYLRYLENALRAEYNLIGTPIIMYAKKSQI